MSANLRWLFFFFFFKYVKWSPVYHVTTICRNHMAADVLWVKVVLLSAYLQSKWQPNRTCFDGAVVIWFLRGALGTGKYIHQNLTFPLLLIAFLYQ